jgi:hypothetical protein
MAMMQIPAEVAAKIATTFRGMPALLALLLVNGLFMGMIVWAMWIAADYRYKERTEVLRLLDRCLLQQQQEK